VEEPQFKKFAWLAAILLLGLGLRLVGLYWGQGYSYFCQGDGIEAYSVAVDYSQGDARAQYIGQPNYNPRSKLPGPLWAAFCALGLRCGGSIQGVALGIIGLNTAAIFLTWLLAERAIGPVGARWAALFHATLPAPVYYSVGVYNPEVMPFLGGCLCLALWSVTQHEKSRAIFWVCSLPLLMLQFHMSGMMLLPAIGLVLWITPRHLNIPWLLGGILAGIGLYIPYLRGEMAHGWQNTLGMVSGAGGGYTWDAFKALTTPLNLLVSWVPQWTRAPVEYRELGRACFGHFGALLAFNILSVVIVGFLAVGAFCELRDAMRGFWRARREAFESAPGPIFLGVVILTPILFSLLSGRPFHARYGLVLLPALLALTGAAAARWSGLPGKGRRFSAALLVMTCSNIWFMAGMYRLQGNRIEQGSIFIPSFRELENVYQDLKANAGKDQPLAVETVVYEKIFADDEMHRDASLIRRYVQVREKETGSREGTRAAPAWYVLHPADEVKPGEPGVAFRGKGIALVAAAPQK
jgi:hypothetical protein